MTRRILLPTILLILAYGFWISPDFKQIASGVAIFLFGMLTMERGFRAFTGGALERLLRRTTDRLWKSVAVGAFTTTIMQSSSLVSVITISFLSAGLISLGAGIGVIFGANLGTTTGAWLVAGFGLKVKLSAYAMPLLVFGVVLIFQRSKLVHGIGYVLAGIGFLFLGIHHMKEGFEAFKEGIDLARYAVAGYPGLFLFVAIGILATVVMQSSHATLVLVITALAAHQVTYENALALAIGSNVGTTITAILGSLGSNIEGKRLAGAHLIFNVATGFIAIAGIAPLMSLVDGMSSSLGIAATDYTLKLAVFHTVFNTIGIVVMAPFVAPLVQTLERWLPTPAPVFEQPRYLNEASIDYADAAIEAARKETVRIYEKALELIIHGIGLRKRDVFSDAPLEQIDGAGGLFEEGIEEQYHQSIKSIYGSILQFISRAQTGMEPENAEELLAIRMAGRGLVEAIKGVKHLQGNLKVLIHSKNPEIRSAYEDIQRRIAHVLREVDSVRHAGEDRLAILSLNETKVAIKQEDILANENLDELVRRDLIPAETATSLINDYRYAYRICKRLIELGQVVFAVHDEALRDAQRSLSLDEDEIDSMAGHGVTR
ncbi:MAG: Na/Pi cotransporter family protein [Deltaproteobacteria bacterium]|nr:Na/Pi cotransporter family protein [Deltaproteobacteria bacterium]